MGEVAHRVLLLKSTPTLDHRRLRPFLVIPRSSPLCASALLPTLFNRCDDQLLSFARACCYFAAVAALRTFIIRALYRFIRRALMLLLVKAYSL